MKKLFLLIAMSAIVTSCSQTSEQTKSENDLEIFLQKIEEDNLSQGPVVSSAYWIGSNFITYDSQNIVADYSKRYTLKSLENSREASSFNSLKTSDSNRRKLELLKSSFVMPPPLDESLASELSSISTKLEAMYGSGEYCYEDGGCYDLEAFEQIIDSSRNPDELLMAWNGWHEVGKPMKPMYMRMVEIGNEGSRDLGYSGLDDLWFSKYDMPADKFLEVTFTLTFSTHQLLQFLLSVPCLLEILDLFIQAIDLVVLLIQEILCKHLERRGFHLEPEFTDLSLEKNMVDKIR